MSGGAEESAPEYPDMALCQDMHGLTVGIVVDVASDPSIASSSSPSSSALVESLHALSKRVFERIGKDLQNPTLYRQLVQTLQQEQQEGGTGTEVAMETDDDDEQEKKIRAAVLAGMDVCTEEDLNKMEEQHKLHIKECEVDIFEAKESAGDMEIMDAYIQMAHFGAKSLDLTHALQAY